MNANGSDQTNLTDDPSSDRSPAWSSEPSGGPPAVPFSSPVALLTFVLLALLIGAGSMKKEEQQVRERG